MKRVFLFLLICTTSCCFTLTSARADETVTVTSTSSDISENLDLKTVATLFGQAEDLEQFEQMLNNPDSAFSNLDLNGDGEVDYLRVIETADNDRHLVVIQAVLAKDIYQDVASIYVEKDEQDQVIVQVVGDEYIYGTNYIIEPVYIYRPLIYDWFWGPSWIAWHSPYYWGYWPGWWRPYYCVDPFIYWDHCYWHHYYHPICSYRTGHHHRPHFAPMRETVRRNDFAQRHPERSFTTRNAARNVTNARQIQQQRRTAMREATATRTTAPTTRVSATTTTRTTPTATRNATYGSSNVRTATRTTPTATRTATTSRSAVTTSRTATTATRTAATTATPSRSSSATVRSSAPSSTRSSSNAVRASSTSSTRSSSDAVRSSSTSTVRSSSSAPTRSTNARPASSGASRTGGGASRSIGGTTRR